jgi:hypothetical protein
MISKTKVQTAAAASATVAALQLMRHNRMQIAGPSEAIYLIGLFAEHFCAGMLGSLTFMVAWDLFSRWRNGKAEEISAIGPNAEPHQRSRRNI